MGILCDVGDVRLMPMVYDIGVCLAALIPLPVGDVLNYPRYTTTARWHRHVAATTQYGDAYSGGMGATIT